jgi:hypothetical protein
LDVFPSDWQSPAPTGGFGIPEARNEAVARALREAFGVGEFEEIRVLTEGKSSARVVRIVVRRRPYLLRIITKTDAPTALVFC